MLNFGVNARTNFSQGRHEELQQSSSSPKKTFTLRAVRIWRRGETVFSPHVGKLTHVFDFARRKKFWVVKDSSSSVSVLLDHRTLISLLSIKLGKSIRSTQNAKGIPLESFPIHFLSSPFSSLPTSQIKLSLLHSTLNDYDLPRPRPCNLCLLLLFR